MGFLERCQSKKIDTSHYAQETPLAFMEITCTFVQEHRALKARVVPWVPEVFLASVGAEPPLQVINIYVYTN